MGHHLFKSREWDIITFFGSWSAVLNCKARDTFVLDCCLSDKMIAASLNNKTPSSKFLATLFFGGVEDLACHFARGKEGGPVVCAFRSPTWSSLGFSFVGEVIGLLDASTVLLLAIGDTCLFNCSLYNRFKSIMLNLSYTKFVFFNVAFMIFVEPVVFWKER